MRRQFFHVCDRQVDGSGEICSFDRLYERSTANAAVGTKSMLGDEEQKREHWLSGMECMGNEVPEADQKTRVCLQK